MSTPHNEETWIDDALEGAPPLLTVREASGLLRMHARTLRRAIAARRIAAIHHAEGGSSRVLVPRAEIRRYLEARAS